MTMTQKPLSELFGVPAPDHVTLDVFERTEFAPKTTSSYVFDKTKLKLLLAYLTGDSNGDGMLIYGPFGCGKTSLIRETLGRLNYPTRMLSWNETSDIADLVGRMGISFGDTRFEYGPLPLAMRDGHALVINEIDRGRAGNLVALNDVLDGGTLLIPETGEVIEPHPNFRLFVTANSAGTGDRTGRYVGSVRQLDPAFLDRFIFLKADYMAEASELDMFMRRFPSYEGQFIQKAVSFAHETRKRSEDLAEPINMPLSTRSLDRFLRLAAQFGIAERSVRDLKIDDLRPAMDAAYFDRLSAEEAEAARTLLSMSF